MMSSESDCWFLDLPTGILHYICVLLLANNGERDLLSLVATCDYLRDTISQFHLGVSVEFSVLCPSYDTPKSLEFDKLNTFLKPSSNWYIKTLTLICDPLAPEWIWYGRGPELKFLNDFEQAFNAWKFKVSDLYLEFREGTGREVTDWFESVFLNFCISTTKVHLYMFKMIRVPESMFEQVVDLKVSHFWKSEDFPHFTALEKLSITHCEHISDNSDGISRIDISSWIIHLQSCRVYAMEAVRWNENDFRLASVIFKNLKLVAFDNLYFHIEKLRHFNSLFISVEYLSCKVYTDYLTDGNADYLTDGNVKLPNSLKSLKMNELTFNLQVENLEELCLIDDKHCLVGLLFNISHSKPEKLKILNVCRFYSKNNDIMRFVLNMIYAFPGLEVLALRQPITEIDFERLQNEFGGFSTLERKVLLQSTLKVLIIGDLPLVISSLADYSLVKRINYLDGKFDWNIGLYWNMDRIVEIKDVFNSASRSKMMMYRQPPPLNYLV